MIDPLIEKSQQVRDQLLKEFGARAGRDGSGHLGHRILDPLARLPRAQMFNSKGEVVGQFL